MIGDLLCTSGVPAAEGGAERIEEAKASEQTSFLCMLSNQQQVDEIQQQLVQSQRQSAQHQQQQTQSQQQAAQWKQQVRGELHASLKEDERLQHHGQQTFHASLRERQEQRWSKNWALGGAEPQERWCRMLSKSHQTEQRHRRGGKEQQNMFQEEQKRSQVVARRLVKPKASTVKTRQLKRDQCRGKGGHGHCFRYSFLLSGLITPSLWPPVLPFSLLIFLFSFKERKISASGRLLVVFFSNLLAFSACSPNNSVETGTKSSVIRTSWSFKTGRASSAVSAGTASSLLVRCSLDAATSGEYFVRRRETPGAHVGPATVVPTIPPSAEIKAHEACRRVDRHARAVSGVLKPRNGPERLQEGKGEILETHANARRTAQSTTSTAARVFLAAVRYTSKASEYEESILPRYLLSASKSKHLSPGVKPPRASTIAFRSSLFYISPLTAFYIPGGPRKLLTSASVTASHVAICISSLSNTRCIPRVCLASCRKSVLFLSLSTHLSLVASSFPLPETSIWLGHKEKINFRESLPLAFQTAAYTSTLVPSFCRHRSSQIPTPSIRPSLSFSRRGSPPADAAVIAAAGVMAHHTGPTWSIIHSSTSRKVDISVVWPRRPWQVAMTFLQTDYLAVGASSVINGTEEGGTLPDTFVTPREPLFDMQHQTKSLEASVERAERILNKIKRQENVTPSNLKDAADHSSAEQKNEIPVFCNEGRTLQNGHAVSVANITKVQCDQVSNERRCGDVLYPLTKEGTTVAATVAAFPAQDKVTGMSAQHSHLRTVPSGSAKAVKAGNAIVCAENANRPSSLSIDKSSCNFGAAARNSSIGEASPLPKRPLTNRHNVGERRRLDRRLTWFKQYPYAPQSPAASKKGKGIKTAAGELPSHVIRANYQVLPARPLPHSLRWKILAETPAPAAAAAAAAAAATQATLDVLGSSTVSAKRRKSKKRLKKQALARAAVAAAAAAQKAPGSAALVAAARWLQAAHFQKLTTVETATSTSTATVVATSTAVPEPATPAEALCKISDDKATRLPPRSKAAVTHPDKQRKDEDGHAKEYRRHGAAVLEAKISNCSITPADSTNVFPSGRAKALKHLSSVANDTQNWTGTLQTNNVSGLEEQHCPSLLSLLYPSRHAAYPPQLAFFVMKQLVTSKFNESVELHVQLNMGSGPRGKARTSGAAAGRVRGYVTLPHGTFGELAEFARSDCQRRQEQMETMHISQHTTNSSSGLCNSSKPTVSAAAEAVFHDGILKKETGVVRGRKKGGVWRRRRIIAAFVDKADEEAAIQAGADIVGAEKILSLLQDGAISFDVLISTPDMVARLTRYGKTLGPKNLLPQDAWGTLSADFCGAIRLYRQTTVPYKSDRFNIVHLTIGHASMPADHLVENLEAALRALYRSRPPSAGSNFFYKVHVSSTMGPGILIDMKHVCLTAGGRSTKRG